MNDSRLFLDHLDTPLGRLALVADAAGRLRALGWVGGHPRMQRLLERETLDGVAGLTYAPDPGGLTTAIRAYFAGEHRAIDGLPVAPDGTGFQRLVWSALRQIPCGETRSYADLARQIGHPRAVRAVGLANGANPIAIVIPCHRVIGADGALTGYGGGLERKRWLLSHESALRGRARAGSSGPRWAHTG